MQRDPAKRHPAIFATLVGGSIAGTLDLTYAIVFSGIRGVDPLRVLQSVAGGWLGSATYEGGASSAILGFVSHFFIAFLMAATFWLVSRRWRFLTRHPVAAGLLYGALLHPFMTMVVLPLSAFPHPFVFKPLFFVINVVAHMVFVGLPISLATHRASAAQVLSR